MPNRVIAATLQTHSHTHTHIYTQSPNYSVFWSCWGSLPITLPSSNYQYKTIKTLQTSVVYSKSLLTIQSLLLSESVFVSESQVCHPASIAYPSYCTPKCSCPWFLFFCWSNLAAVTRYSVISATGKAVDSRGDKEPQSTSDKEVKSDLDQTFPQNKPGSSKCQYCRALSSGRAPSLTRDRSIRRARTLCLGFPLSF